MARVALSTAPFSSIQKGDNMKKIKKIFPLLLGIMVLMFGTLTVSAASITYPDAMISFRNDVENYCATKGYKEATYWYYRYWTGTFGDKYIEVYNTNTPLIYNAETNKFTLTPRDDGDYYCRYFWNNSSGIQSTLRNADNIGSRTASGTEAVNYDMKNSIGDVVISNTGTDFFPIPPVARVAEKLPGVVRNQTKVILITAVACLALLVILSVLPKKLPRFLNR